MDKIMLEIKRQRLSNKKSRIETYIKELNKNQLYVLIKIIDKFYCMNKNEIFFYMFLIDSIIKFNLYEYVFSTFKKYDSKVKE